MMTLEDMIAMMKYGRMPPKPRPEPKRFQCENQPVEEAEFIELEKKPS